MFGVGGRSGRVSYLGLVGGLVTFRVKGGWKVLSSFVFRACWKAGHRHINDHFMKLIISGRNDGLKFDSCMLPM